jgi:two-component system, chemotaxis family, sensor kinase CheA
MKDKKKEESLKEFVGEAEEILDGLNQNLSILESADNKGSVPEVINAIFRAAHTLKGMSGMVGLKKVSELSHCLEDLLDRLRMGKLQTNSYVMDTLFAGAEGLRKLIEMVSAGRGEKIDVEPILKKIEQALTGGVPVQSAGPPAGRSEPPPVAPSPLEEQGVPAELVKVLTEYESHRLLENIKSGKHLFEIHSRFRLETFDKDLTRLNAKLANISEIVTTLPSSGMSPETGIEFNLIVATAKDLLNLKTLLADETIEIKPLKLEKPGSRAAEKESTGIQDDSTSIKSLSQTVRVDIGKLDGLLSMLGELVQTRAVLSQISKDWLTEPGLAKKAVDLQKAVQALERQVTQLQEGLIEVRMIPVGQIFDRLIRVVRKLSKEMGKEVDLQLSGEETRLDKSMVEEIADPLMHLIRNSIDHGIESKQDRLKVGKPEVGVIRLKASQKGNNVVIEVQDDGRGIDLERVYQTAIKKGLTERDREYEKQELLNFLFLPGFSTSDQVTEVSGRGVGLDVVARNISKLSGMVDVETELGQGTRFSITLPITLIIIKALIVKVGGEIFAIPLGSVSESLMIEQKDIRTVERREVIQLRNQTLSLLRLRDAFRLPKAEALDSRVYAIVVGLAEKRLGLVVDAIEGQQEIVIKSIGGILRDTPGIAGATELGNRKTILVLDAGTLIEEATQGRTSHIKKGTGEGKRSEDRIATGQQ